MWRLIDKDKFFARLGVFVFIFIGVILLRFLAALFLQTWQCSAPGWGIAEIEDLILETSRKAGGLPQLDNVSLRMSTVEEVELYAEDTVADWRVRDVSVDTFYDRDWDFRYWFSSKVEVLYSNGEWRELDLYHLRSGFVVVCLLEPITINKWRGWAKYDTIATEKSLRLVNEGKYEFGQGNQWGYQVFSKFGSDSKILTIQIDDLELPFTLDTFAIYNQTLSEQLITEYDELFIQIIFKDPVSVEMVEEISKKYGTKSVVVSVVTLNIDGKETVWPITLGDEVTQLDDYLVDSLSDEPWLLVSPVNLEFIGVSGISAEIPAKNYNALSKHNDILLIDLTPTLARNAFHAQTGEIFTQNDLMGYAPIGQQLNTALLSR